MIADGLIVVAMIYLAFYFVPTVVAASRRIAIPDILFVFVTNLVGGWTGLGWIVALVVALRFAPRGGHPINTPPPPPPPPPPLH